MDMNALPPDFVEFLRLLEEADVEYLIVGGYAVGYYGYPRTTADMDVWVAVSPKNAEKLVQVFRRFGMKDESVSPSLFLKADSIIRMGVPPVRIEVLTGIDGVEFTECFRSRTVSEVNGQKINLISLRDLVVNKRASGRHKDLDDLEHLPTQEN